MVNGASELLAKVFGEAGRHARSAVGVAELPLGAPVEVELDRGAGVTSPDDPGAAACHELLVPAGRAAARPAAVAAARVAGHRRARGRRGTAAAALLRNRVGLTDEERDLLEPAVAEHAPRKLLDAVLTVTVPDEPDVTFRSAPDPDVAALSLLAVARGESGCVELRQVLRGSGRNAQRVVLVRAEGPRPWVLGATLARLLRAHGDPAPCVELLPGGSRKDDNCPPTTGPRWPARPCCGAAPRRSAGADRAAPP